MSTRKIKVVGAGSIGNHMSHAARRLGWAVTLCDTDPAALERTRTGIYPGRYGVWDDGIDLCLAAEAPAGGFDLIVVGTPPDTHMPLALAAVAEKPGAVLVEKPLCGVDLDGAQALLDASRSAGVPVFVGYDHVVGAAADGVVEAAASADAGAARTIDVEFREYWGGIFKAHPWLDGPADSYLGYWRRGGGASGEHSHAINLWQHFAHSVGAGRVVEVSATLDYVREGDADYDRLALMNLITEHGLMGRVVQDVVTSPPRKWARIQFDRGHAEWHCGYRPDTDAFIHRFGDGEAQETLIAKTRPDDFIRELRHIADAVADGDAAASPISLERGADTMLVVAAAHRSAQTRRTVRIDYDAGAVPAALIDL